MKDTELPLPTINSFGELLKFLRRRAQLSQRDLSIAVGYSESQISRLESNQRIPDRASLLALFVPALQIHHEQKIIDRLLELAAASHLPVPGKQPFEPPEKRSRLPTQLTSFIGRQQDLQIISQLLNDPENRLVTLVGEGGCGKTRLALQVGTNLNRNYPHGVQLVELGAINDPELVLRVTCSALGLYITSDKPLIDSLAEFLLDKELLLILDNCEHLIEAVARMADELLHACPQLKILATSREVLSISGEAIFRVSPLPVPPERPGGHLTRTQVEPYEAVQLFVARARSTMYSFELDDENAPLIDRICRRLDGIPLALELTATWVNSLSLEQIADRLEESLELLVNRTRAGSLSKHQTMSAAIDWSYNLLSGSERWLLRCLSIFSGSWSLEAAEELTAGLMQTSQPAPVSLARGQVLATLANLVNKSLIVAFQTEETTTRYRLLNIIRDHLQEKAAQDGELDGLQNQHLEYFCRLAELAEPNLKTRNQERWMSLLIQEQDNFRSALSYSLSLGRPDQGLRLVAALGHFWWMKGYDREHIKWFETLLQRTKPDIELQHSTWRAKTLLYYGIALELTGQSNPVIFMESLEVSRQASDPVCAGAALGLLATSENDYEKSMALFDESLQILQREEDDWWIAETLH